MKSVFLTEKFIFASIIAGILFVLPVQADSIKFGEKVSFDRKKGNCIACHAMPTANPKKAILPGNMAPALVAMKARYANKSDLRAQIHDATVKNPYSIMPPFGSHRVLTPKEVDAVTDYIYTL